METIPVTWYNFYNFWHIPDNKETIYSLFLQHKPKEMRIHIIN